MSSYVKSSQVMSSQVMSCQVMSCQVMSCHVMLSQGKSSQVHRHPSRSRPPKFSNFRLFQNRPSITGISSQTIDSLFSSLNNLKKYRFKISENTQNSHINHTGWISFKMGFLKDRKNRKKGPRTLRSPFWLLGNPFLATIHIQMSNLGDRIERRVWTTIQAPISQAPFADGLRMVCVWSADGLRTFQTELRPFKQVGPRYPKREAFGIARKQKRGLYFKKHPRMVILRIPNGPK